MRTKVFQLTVFVIFFPLLAMAAEKQQDNISLNIPTTVVQQIITAVVPLQINSQSNILTGIITVDNIKNLKFGKQSLASDLSLSGNDMRLAMDIGGYAFNAKVGNVHLDFACDAKVRFDEATQTLFVRPVVSDVSGDGTQGVADIGQALIGLLNGQEFPIKMDELEPIIARASNKTITINSHIKNIRLQKSGLVLDLVPLVSTK